MPRKSNKTAHVLSLLTNPEIKDEEKSEPLNSSDESSISKENQTLSVFSNYQNEALSGLIKDELTKLAHSEGIAEPEKNEAEPLNNTDYNPEISSVSQTFSENATASEKEENTSVESFEKDEVENNNPQTKHEPNIKNDKNQNEIIKEAYKEKEETPENKAIITSEKEKTEANINSVKENFESKAKKFCLNIMENLVLDYMKDIIPKTGVCSCERCIKDILAISLNNLPPKYIVTDKGKLMSLVDVYRYQYSISIMTEITKACFIVKNSPNH